MIFGCQHRSLVQNLDGKSAGTTMACGRPSTHVCLVECIGEPGPQSRVERRCSDHAENKRVRDIIESWTNEEWERLES